MCRGAKAIFVERKNGRFRLRRGFTIPPGARVLMVEDIITTGLSSRETLEALAEHPGTIVGAACLIDRSGGKTEIGVRRVALATLDIPAYPADALPPELAAIPAVKPGEPRPGRAEVRVSNMTALFILYGRIT
jgi:orotate phosphoribosyltransferase